MHQYSKHTDFNWNESALLAPLTADIKKNPLHWKFFARWNQTIHEASMGGPLQNFLISFRSEYNRYVRHGEFLFLIGLYKKFFSSQWNRLAKWNKTRQEAFIWGPLQCFFSFRPDRTIIQKVPMEGFLSLISQIWLPHAILISDWLIF